MVRNYVDISQWAKTNEEKKETCVHSDVFVTLATSSPKIVLNH